MASKNQFARTTRDAPSAPMRGTFIAPTLLHVCCICGHIRVDQGKFRSPQHWVTQGRYRKTHGGESGRFPSHSHILSEMFHEGPSRLRRNRPAKASKVRTPTVSATPLRNRVMLPKIG